MKAGTFRLTFCAGEGSYRYQYDVAPDTAGFVAAAQIARVAMESAMQAAAVGRPLGTSMYTKRQQEIIERFRQEMAAAGGLLPSMWQQSSVHEIAQAGIDAVRRWKP
jgi:hypothetical protein